MRMSHSKGMRVGNFAQALLVGEEKEQPRDEVPSSARAGEMKRASDPPLFAFCQKKLNSLLPRCTALSRK